MAQAMAGRRIVVADESRGPALRLPGFGWWCAVLCLTALVIEGLLAFRVWVQLSGETLAVPFFRLAYQLSGELVEPFKALETTVPIKTNGILEMSSLIAVEAYLVAAVLALGLSIAVRSLVRWAAARFEVHRSRVSSPAAMRQAA